MEPYRRFSGIAAVLAKDNVDTDAILPSAWMRSPRADLARGLFARWRFGEDGRENPDFVLNRPPFREASVLIAGANFGCGSSREAAPWALLRFGIRCVLAPSFADIFYENAFRNGLLAAIAAPEAIARLTATLARTPDPVVDVDLEGCTIRHDHVALSIEVPERRRQALLRGLDAIEATLEHETAIAAFEERRRRALSDLDGALLAETGAA